MTMTKIKNKEEGIRVNTAISMPGSMTKKLRVAAELMDISFSELIVIFCRQYLESQEYNELIKKWIAENK